MDRQEKEFIITAFIVSLTLVLGSIMITKMWENYNETHVRLEMLKKELCE